MQRQRGELVPIGEVIADLPGPVKAIREASPQALHHFTQVDQVNQLVGASEADPDLGFMARLLALCSLPRTNPGNRKEYVRRNGPYTLVMSAGGLNSCPSATFRVSYLPGSQPKRCGPKAARSAWAVRSPGSCESLVWKIEAEVLAATGRGSAIK